MLRRPEPARSLRFVVPSKSAADLLSAHRLARFAELTGGDETRAVDLYEWNIRLAEAFYTPLHFVELIYRNYLHRELIAAYGQRWMSNSDCPLQQDARDELFRARALDESDLKGLSLGFWVALIGPRYDHSLWRQALYKAFRPDGVRKRSVIHGRLNRIRRFRNRVMHHDPICEEGLFERHAEMIEAVGWLCPDASRWLESVSRFQEVAGPASLAFPRVFGGAA